jgi:hypothetical protein
MARKKSGAKFKKATPAVRYLRYELTNSSQAGTETSHYIDLARDLSAINRRLYRQGRAYHIRKITLISKNTENSGVPAPGGNRISISTVPDSWTARNAWKRGFEAWTNQRKMVSQGTNMKPGKFDDFKIHLSFDSRGATKLVPLDNGGNALQLGEWDYATLYSPDGTTSADPFDLHMLGDHSGSAGSWNSVGLIKSYGESRVTVSNQQPNQPSTTSDDPLVNLHDDGTVFDEVVQNMELSNDNAPYDLTNYPGSDGNMAKPLVVQDTCLVDGRAVMGGFTAICGLLEIESQSSVIDDVISVLVEVAPGNYRGIGAEVI